MALNPTLYREREGTNCICFCTHANRAARMQKSICLITTGVSQEIKKKKPLRIKSFELNIREVQSSALTEKKGKSLSSCERGEESEVEGGRL